jgi:prepilin-type N-terminal cleavage/methylation domain-containing protein
MVLARSHSSRFADQRGFSLPEVLVAMAILTFSLVALAQLFATATRANLNARTTTLSTSLSQQKIEQLRSLTWGFDQLGLPVSDFTSDTAVSPASPSGGTGLSPSPANSLLDNVTGYVDYLNEYGESLGGGAGAPPGTVYVRRWSVEPLPTNPNNTLIIQALTFKLGGVRSTAGGAATGNRLPEESRMTTVKTRKSQ